MASDSKLDESEMVPGVQIPHLPPKCKILTAYFCR